jgi:bacteriocin-like protein
VWPHRRLDGPFAGLMEKIMSKSNDTSKLDRATNELRDDELQKVSGGLKVTMEDILVTSVATHTQGR